MYIVSGAMLCDNGGVFLVVCHHGPRVDAASPPPQKKKLHIDPFSLFWPPLDLCRNKTATRRLNLEQFPQTSRRRFIVPNHPAFPKVVFHSRRIFQVAVGQWAFGIDAIAIERHAIGCVEMWND